MNRRDKTKKGGAPAATPGRRQTASVAATATITASILQGRLQPARGGTWLLVAQCHCVVAARPHRVIASGGAE